jgi:broad specificity phosphatase PhoE
MKSRPSPGTVRLLLIRHGATEANERRPYVLQGQGVNHSLSSAGQQQARALGEFLSEFEIDAVYASPLKRAQETAAAVAEHHSLAVRSVERLTEVDVGEWEGASWDDVMARWPEYYARFVGDPGRVPYLGGESYADVQNRAVPALAELLEDHDRQVVAVVAHNVVNRVVLARYLGLDLSRAKDLRQENAGVNVIDFKNTAPQVQTVNSAFHVPSR